MKRFYNKARILFILALLFFTPLIFFSDGVRTSAYIDGSGNDAEPWKTLYHDGTYEYDYGTNILMANYQNGGYTPNDLNASNPTSMMDTSNRRTRTTAIVNDDRRGWEFLYASWMDENYFNAYHQMGTYSEGYNEYWLSTYNPIWADGLEFGIQDGGPNAYRSDDGRLNQYRRPAIMVYRRQVPQPIFGTTYVKPTAGAYYKSGSTLWVQGNRTLPIRTYSYDTYPNSYGQSAQYEANIRYNNIRVQNIWDHNIDFNRQIDAKDNSTVSSYNTGYDNGANVIYNSMRVYWAGYNSGSRDYVGGLYRNGLGSEMTINLPGNYDFTIYADSQSKYGNWHGYRSGFGIAVDGGESNSAITYSYLRSDVDAPTISDAYATNITADGFDIVVKNVNDNGRSGVQLVRSITWIDGWNVDGQWKDTASSGGDVTIHINRSDFGGRFGTYQTDIRTVDNVNNGSVVLKHLNVQLVNPVPTNCNFAVQQYSYKDPSNPVYWMKVGSEFAIYNDGRFPSSYGIYPMQNYVLFEKDGTGITGNSARFLSDTGGNYIYGTEFGTYLANTRGYGSWTTQSGGYNYLCTTHYGKGLVDGSAFKLRYCTTYTSGGIQYYTGYEDPGVWMKFDGSPPTGTLAATMNLDTDTLTINANNVVDSGSGVKDVYAKFYDPANPYVNVKTVTLTPSGTNWSATANVMQNFTSDSIQVDLYAEDNVGNLARIGTDTKNLFTVGATVAPYNHPEQTSNPILMRGQRGVLKITTTGYVERLTIEFDSPCDVLNKSLTITPKSVDHRVYEFDIPLDGIEDKQYTITVKGYKSDRVRTATPTFSTNGSIFDRLRTRVLN